MAGCALSTIDNPYNPFNDFNLWYVTDLELSRRFGVTDTCSLLAQFAYTSADFSDADNADAINEAINSIIENDLTNRYIKFVEMSS